MVAVRFGQEVGVRVPGYSAEVYFPLKVGVGRGCCRAPAYGCAQRVLQWVHWTVMGSGTAYMVKGPTVRCMWRGMKVQRSARRAVQLLP